MQSLSNIILFELQANVDFMMKLKDNIQSGYFKVPDSFMYHISAKYGISMDEFLSYEKQIIDLVLPMFARDEAYKETYKVPVTAKKRILATIPPAEFQN